MGEASAYERGVTGIFGNCCGFGGRYTLRIWEIGSGRDTRRGGVTGKLEHESDRSSLHRAGRTPWAFGISIAAVIAIVLGVGIDDNAGRAAFLGDKLFHAAKILSVADDHDLASDVDIHLLELVEIGGRAVVGVDDFGLGVPGGRHAVEAA